MTSESTGCILCANYMADPKLIRNRENFCLYHYSQVISRFFEEQMKTIKIVMGKKKEANLKNLSQRS